MSRRSGEAARFWKVGELAERCGLTVRTLHHYDSTGLLRPSVRTESAHGAGHRLYGEADVARLQQILSLKLLGFSLDQIREQLGRDEYDPRQVLRLHLASVRGQLAELTSLESRLRTLADALDRAEAVSVEEFLTTIQGMTMIEKYYTADQLAALRKRREEVGEEAMNRAPQQWADLQAEVQAAMDEGVDPPDPRAGALARRWFDLVSAFTGGDPEIFKSLNRMYANEDRIRDMDVAAMRPMIAWIGEAAEAAGVRHPGM
ncbi:MerR family transcriptional regulator [Paludisphaera mucosa]|uniref:MerR family transcriptional regulator n=1 Tax=Paludisphaera mucosa TaxID=3030827 RepID=A0ABT6FJZ4_9BACT|nr:MerR family transcriptional regulator [Paludisphaera mucosa]MDG3007896.1 MerR family transcriptional regulator [Paludisphaera mucosa]